MASRRVLNSSSVSRCAPFSVPPMCYSTTVPHKPYGTLPRLMVDTCTNSCTFQKSYYSFISSGTYILGPELSHSNRFTGVTNGHSRTVKVTISTSYVFEGHSVISGSFYAKVSDCSRYGNIIEETCSTFYAHNTLKDGITLSGQQFAPYEICNISSTLYTGRRKSVSTYYHCSVTTYDNANTLYAQCTVSCSASTSEKVVRINSTSTTVIDMSQSHTLIYVTNNNGNTTSTTVNTVGGQYCQWRNFTYWSDPRY